jgi:hypothetical protein
MVVVRFVTAVLALVLVMVFVTVVVVVVVTGVPFLAGESSKTC